LNKRKNNEHTKTFLDLPGVSRDVAEDINWLLSLYSPEQRAFVIDSIDPALAVGEQAFSYFKFLGDRAKYYGPALSQHWRCLVNLELMFGYVLPGSTDAALEYMRKWFIDESTVNVRIRPKFIEAMRSIIGGMPRVSQPTLAEFATKPELWVSAGSAPDSYIRIDGKDVPANKLFWAASHTPADILKEMRIRDATLHPFPKVERGKVRWVVSATMADYLRESYVLSGLDLALATIGNTWNWNGPADTARKRDQLLSDVRQPDRWHVPFDFEKFDNQVSWWMIEDTYTVLSEVMGWQNTERGLYLLELIATRRGADIMATQPYNFVLKYRKGLPSGWRSTSMLGTLINMALLRAVGLESGIMPCNSWHQGDDAALTFMSSADAHLYLLAAAAIGIQYNPSKFFIAKHRNEFLRMSCEPSGFWGYPARMAMVVRLKKPTPLDANTTVERIGQWHLIYRRLGLAVDEARVAWDISQHLRVSVIDATSLMHGNPSRGGGGVTPINKSRFKHVKYKTRPRVHGAKGVPFELLPGLAAAQEQRQDVIPVIDNSLVQPIVARLTNFKATAKFKQEYSGLWWDLWRRAYQDDPTVIFSQLDDPSMAFLVRIASRWRRSVVMMWIRGELSVPVSYPPSGQGSVLASFASDLKPDLASSLCMLEHVNLDTVTGVGVYLSAMWHVGAASRVDIAHF
jgi:hypothetical protein